MDKAKKTIPIPEEIMDFYRALVEVHEKFLEDLPSLKLTRSQKDSSLDQKAPLLNFVDLKLDREKVKEAIKEVCRLVGRYRPQAKEPAQKIEKVLLDMEDSRPLLEKALWQDSSYVADYAGKHNLNKELLSFTLFNVLKPFITNAAKALKGQYNVKLWHHNYCPVCGWKPNLAFKSEKPKQRMLHCSLCDTEWSFKNLECPHCLNENHESLKYFTVEGEKTYRVNVCDECNGYIKTVDEAEILNKENAVLTDIKTIYLDILAENKGYKKEVEVNRKADN